MKKILFTSLLLPIFLCSCSDDDNDFTRQNPEEPSTYYVRYTVDAGTSYRGQEYSIEIGTPEGDKKFTYHGATDFEETIGPVKKNFTASIYCNKEGAGSSGYFDARIHVSKDNGPFALKNQRSGIAPLIVTYKVE